MKMAAMVERRTMVRIKMMIRRIWIAMAWMRVTRPRHNGDGDDDEGDGGVDNDCDHVADNDGDDDTST